MEKIAIIGASYLQLPLVLKAKELNIETYCFAWEDGAICKDYCDHFYPISITDKDQILEICKQESINGILTIASDLAVITVNYVVDKLKLIGNAYHHTKKMTDKFEMRKALMDANVPCPRFWLSGNLVEEEYRNFEYPLIVKPTDRSGSRGVTKVNNENELMSAIERAKGESFNSEAIVEEFVDGVEISVESISYKGKHYVLQITDKETTGAPYFVEIAHHQPSQLPNEIKKSIEKITIDSLNALRIENGASHAEMKINKSGEVKVIEVGARMGGDFIGSHLVELSTGYDFLKGVIDVSLGKFEEPKIIKYYYSGVYFLCKETEYLINKIKEAEKNPQIIKAEITTSKLTDIKCSGDRSGYMIYQSEKKYKI